LLPAPTQPLYLTGLTPPNNSSRKVPATKKVPRGQPKKEDKNLGGNHARLYTIIKSNKEEPDNEMSGNI
jgi:hypothetical protein